MEVRFWRDGAMDAAFRALAESGLTMLAPVRPLSPVAIDGRETVGMEFACSWLLPNGRCGGYDERPQMCRIFPEGGDRLCVHFNGAEGFAG